jgi:AbrB family looped-hinge helix DNA binding protein
MTRKGQITIPANNRRLWSIEAGDRVEFLGDGDRVRIVPVGDDVKRTTGALGRYRSGPAPTVEELKDAVADAWAAEAMRHMEP